MSKLIDKLGNTSKETGIEKYPLHCMVAGCGDKTAVALVRVRDQRGFPHTGAFSEFGFINGGNWIMKDRYTFDSWVTRCASCYREAIIKQNESIENRKKEAAA